MPLSCVVLSLHVHVYIVQGIIKHGGMQWEIHFSPYFTGTYTYVDVDAQHYKYI